MYPRKHNKKVIIMAIAAFFLFGIAASFFTMSQHTQGVIELPEHLTSAEIMARIASNFEQLGGADSPFSTSAISGLVTALDYADDRGLSIMLTMESGASPEEVLAAKPQWQGKYLGTSDLLASMSGSGKYMLSFVCSQGPLVLVITQEDAASISTAPLEEAIALIEGIIGTP